MHERMRSRTNCARLGVGPGVLVALCVPRSPALLAALLGVQKSGGAYVPLDPDYPSQRLDYMMADSGRQGAGHGGLCDRRG